MIKKKAIEDTKQKRKQKKWDSGRHWQAHYPWSSNGAQLAPDGFSVMEKVKFKILILSTVLLINLLLVRFLLIYSIRGLLLI